MSQSRPNSYYGTSSTTPVAATRVRSDKSWINRSSSEESVLRETPQKLEIGDTSNTKLTSKYVSSNSSGYPGVTSPGYKSRSTSNISYSSGGTSSAYDSRNSTSTSNYTDRTDGPNMTQKITTSYSDKSDGPNMTQKITTTTRTQTESWSSKKDTSNSQNNWTNAWHHCTRCNHALGKKDCFVLEHLKQYFHKDCFNCGICDTPLGNKGDGDRLSVVNKQVCCDRCFDKQRRR
uniref:LIM and calponin homology domains-containing protein 1-like n=1 Tax=Myxine glutinosa TaxID=7769 RepID=UPI00358FAD9A